MLVSPLSRSFGLAGALGHHSLTTTSTLNAYPANYKSDILGAMHAYLDNPTGIRDAAIGEPALKTKGGTTRYVVCLKFNGKKNGSNDYAGTKEIAAEFMVGRFDQFIDRKTPRIYAPARPTRRSRNCKTCRRNRPARPIELAVTTPAQVGS